MTQQDATKVVVAMAQARAEDTEEGEALRLILRELKDSRVVGIQGDQAIINMQRELDEAGVPK